MNIWRQTMTQTDLTQTQDYFIQELTSLIAVVNRNLITLNNIQNNYTDIVMTIKRIEHKIDMLHSDMLETEQVN